MKFKKNITIAFILCFLFAFKVQGEDYVIDATLNAQIHNSKGISYLEEKKYLPAIREFKLAIALSPENDTTAVYFANLGNAYMQIARAQSTYGLPEREKTFAYWAEISYKKAIAQDNMNLNYYKDLVVSFAVQGKLMSELASYMEKAKKDPMAQIVVGLIYQRQNQTRNAQICFDDFISNYPNLIITNSLRAYASSVE